MCSGNTCIFTTHGCRLVWKWNFKDWWFEGFILNRSMFLFYEQDSSTLKISCFTQKQYLIEVSLSFMTTASTFTTQRLDTRASMEIYSIRCFVFAARRTFWWWISPKNGCLGTWSSRYTWEKLLWLFFTNVFTIEKRLLSLSSQLYSWMHS